MTRALNDIIREKCIKDLKCQVVGDIQENIEYGEF